MNENAKRASFEHVIVLPKFNPLPESSIPSIPTIVLEAFSLFDRIGAMVFLQRHITQHVALMLFLVLCGTIGISLF